MAAETAVGCTCGHPAGWHKLHGGCRVERCGCAGSCPPRPLRPRPMPIRGVKLLVKLLDNELLQGVDERDPDDVERMRDAVEWLRDRVKRA